MDGGPHERAADDLPFAKQAAQLPRFEVLQPGPQPDIGVARLLGLHTNEVLDHLQGGPPDPPQQQLPFEQRTVASTPFEQGGGGGSAHRHGAYGRTHGRARTLRLLG
jgi:hypothetical protein